MFGSTYNVNIIKYVYKLHMNMLSINHDIRMKQFSNSLHGYYNDKGLVDLDLIHVYL